MSDSKITLIGCNSYFDTLGQSLFDYLSVPSGITKDTLTDTILLRGGEFEIIMGDPEFLRYAIGAWSRKWMPTMERWARALEIEYNPLENYDRKEDWTDKTDGSGASSTQNTSHRDLTSDTDNDSSTASSENSSGSETMIHDRDKYSSPPTHETLKSAYDSSSYSPVQKDIDTGKWEEGTSRSESANSSNASSTNEHFHSDDDYSNREDSSSAMSQNAKHNGRIHGNIGVTTSQQMLEAELQLGYWNIYEKITELFLQEFTIPVYV